MKIAEAIVRIKALRKEVNEAEVVLYSEGTEVVPPQKVVEVLDTRRKLLGEIARLKSLIARTNVLTTVSFNGATLSLSQALNLLDAMREEKTYLETFVVRQIKGAVPVRMVRVGADYIERTSVPLFTLDEAFEVKNTAVKLEADVTVLASLINYTNWNTELITT